MKRSARIAPRIAIVWALASTAAAARPPAERPPVPPPDLAPLEGQVAEQLAAGRRRLDALRAGPEPPAAALAAAYGELAVLYHAYGLVEPAEACYGNAARLAPADPRWPHGLGLLLQETGRLDEAAAAYEKSLALSPPEKSLAPSEKSLAPSAAPSAGAVSSLLHLGEIRRLQGRPAAAEAVLRRALAADPASPAARALLGQTALDLGRPREAADLLAAALAQVPAATRLHYPLAQAYRGLGERQRAAEHLALAGQVGLRPADPLVDELASVRTGERVHMTRGQTAFRAGRYAEAAAELHRALAARPESVEARIDLAAALVNLGEARQAEAELRAALGLDPTNPTAHFNLGSLLAAAGPAAAAEAREHLAFAARALPRDAGAHRALGRLLQGGGRPEEALAELARAVELDPADDVARLEEAEALVRLARYGAARRRLEDGLSALPASGLLAHGLARLLAACPETALRDGVRARDLATAVWQARPTPEHAETMALAAAELGRCGEAARWQRTAIEILGSAATDPGAADRQAAMRARLARYERGAPCRPPS